jgi:hypothetical protein
MYPYHLDIIFGKNSNTEIEQADKALLSKWQAVEHYKKKFAEKK